MLLLILSAIHAESVHHLHHVAIQGVSVKIVILGIVLKMFGHSFELDRLIHLFG